jgi:hypothetical protein
MTAQQGVIQFEQRPEWLKVVIPGQRNRLLFALYSVCLLIWAVMLGWVIVYVTRNPGFGFVNIVLIILWALIWLWFGRILWARWQHHAANREILFINEEQLIVRRPVSLLGPTTTYDMKFVSPFYYSDKHHCPVFDYGYQHVYFGQGLAKEEADALIGRLNAAYFPDEED